MSGTFEIAPALCDSNLNKIAVALISIDQESAEIGTEFCAIKNFIMNNIISLFYGYSVR